MKQMNMKITIWNNKIKFKYKNRIKYFLEIQVKLIVVNCERYLKKF